VICTAGETELGWWNERECDGLAMWHVWRSGEMHVGLQWVWSNRKTIWKV